MKFRTHLKALPADTYATAVVKNILYLSNINLPSRAIADVIRWHPLQTIADYLNLLKSLGIEYNSVQTSLSELSDFDNLMLVIDNSKVTLIRNVQATSAYAFDPVKGWIKKALVDISSSETTKVIVINAFYEVGVKKYLSTAVRNNRLGTIIGVILTMLLFILLNQPSFIASGVFASGIVLSILAIWESKAQLNSVSFCDLTKSSACGTVLNSKHARSFGVSVSFAALVFYIFGLLVSLIDSTQHGAVIQSMSIAAGLITVYFASIQAFIIRAFCTLCLAIGAFNILLFGAVKAYEFESVDINSDLGPIAVLLLVAIAAALFIVWVIDTRIDNDVKDSKLNVFNAAYPFEAKLSSLPEIKINRQEDYEIYYGNPLGELIIDLFISLSCQKCRTSLRDAERIVQASKRVKISVHILNVGDNDAKTRFRQLASLRISKGNNKCIALLTQYANTGSFPVQLASIDDGMALINFHESNAKRNNIRMVPAFAVNDRLLGKEFGLIDLAFYVCQV